MSCNCCACGRNRCCSRYCNRCCNHCRSSCCYVGTERACDRRSSVDNSRRHKNWNIRRHNTTRWRPPERLRLARLGRQPDRRRPSKPKSATGTLRSRVNPPRDRVGMRPQVTTRLTLSRWLHHAIPDNKMGVLRRYRSALSAGRQRRNCHEISASFGFALMTLEA